MPSLNTSFKHQISRIPSSIDIVRNKLPQQICFHCFFLSSDLDIHKTKTRRRASRESEVDRYCPLDTNSIALSAEARSPELSDLRIDLTIRFRTYAI
jgi:hypothetical protein